MRVTDDHSNGYRPISDHFSPGVRCKCLLYFYCYIYILHVCNVNQNLL